MRKKSKEDEQTLQEFNLAHRRSQAKCQLIQTSYIKRIKLFLFSPFINILLTELSLSVWENLDLGRVYRPHCVRSVLSTSVKIYIYLINQARGPYWENIGPRSWQYGPSAAMSVQERPRADILPVQSRASLVNKRFITWLKLVRRKTQMIDCKDTINFKRAIFI